MGKKYTKKTRSSRRISPARMRGRIVSRDEATVQLQLPIAEVLAGMGDTVEALAAEAGLLVMKALIDADLLRRGLRTDQPYLFVLDGSAALHKAVEKTFGRRAVVQRCQVHKERNVSATCWDIFHRNTTRRYVGVCVRHGA